MLTHEDRKTLALDAFIAAAERFIAKVDSGQARSTVTYNELKAALEIVKGRDA